MRFSRASSKASPTFLSFGFRPFFLAAGVAAPLLVIPWLMVVTGKSSVLQGINPLEWHTHEMVFGFAGAAVAGFLLTAVANWTARPPVRGLELGGLFLAWLLGRIAMSGATGIPPLAVMLVDLLFPFFLVLLLAREIIRSENKRNLPLVAVIGLLALMNLAFHLGAARIALNLALHLLLLLVTIIGARVIPAFTANWLRARGVPTAPPGRSSLGALQLPAVVAVGLADAFATGSALAGLLAGLLAVLTGLRLVGWQGLRARREPLVAVLHVAYAWLVLGYLLLAASSFTELIPRSAALHALGAGAIGNMMLAIMSRASLGHTGRPLHAPPAALWAYVLAAIGAALRVLASLWPGFYAELLWAAGAIWSTAFLVFAIGYFRILTGPRVDGD